MLVLINLFKLLLFMNTKLCESLFCSFYFYNHKIFPSQLKEKFGKYALNLKLSTIEIPDDDFEDERAEIIFSDEENEEEIWISDRELIRRAVASPGGEALTNRDKRTFKKIRPAAIPDEDIDSEKSENKLIYNEEEQKLMKDIGGKESPVNSREPGYLGDSTLEEIAMDFSVPICYIADVLVTWGCPIPIDTSMRLGDLVTGKSIFSFQKYKYIFLGEQAFALLEAIHTLDMAQIQDTYSNYDLMTVSEDNDIDLKEAFNFVMKKGWSLPFGMQTCLRVTQEDELIETLADYY